MKLADLNIKAASGSTKTRCPKCDGDRSDKRDTSLSVNLDSGLFKCHYCGEAGKLEEYRSPGTGYELPKLNNTKLGDRCFDYLKSRGLSLRTINRNKLTQSSRGHIEFNYFEGDKLVNIKYRSIDEKKFYQFKNGRPILYGLNDIIEEKEVIIVEGEIDKLSIEEAGYTNCVSVPLGAPNENDKNADSKLKCFEHARAYFDEVDRIIIATDNDNNGRRLQKEVARRLGKERCFIVDYGAFKDANEVLCKMGKEHLKQCIVTASPYPLEGVTYISDYRESILDLHRNGISGGASVGLGSEFDHHFMVKPGLLTIVTGIPTHGKSAFVENMMMNLINDHGWKFGVFSPEHAPFEMHFQRLCRIHTGKMFFKTSQSLYIVSEEEVEAAMDHLTKHIFPIQPEGDRGLDSILEIASQLVLTHGINGLIIDPWTDIEHKITGTSETMYVSKALSEIKKFNHRHDVHTFLIVHPTKMMKRENGEYYVPRLYDCAGSANFYNRADFGMSVFRRSDDTVEVHMQKVKYEGILGSKGMAHFRFDKVSCRYIHL